MRYGSLAGLRNFAVAFAAVGLALLVLVGTATAATFHPLNGEQLEENITTANGNGQANTFVLAGGGVGYLPLKTLTLTNTSGPQRFLGPSGSPASKGAVAEISGTGIEPVSELFVVAAGVSVTFNHVELAITGGEALPGVEIAGENELTKKPGGKVTVENSTVAGSPGSAFSVGGGATLTVRNSTISDGRDFAILNNGTTSLFNTTVAFNSFGIENQGTLKLTNSIVANNKGGDCSGLAASSDHSLDDDGTCNVGSLSKTNPQLVTGLQNTGGTTPVHGLKLNSPAIGAGNSATCTTTDQRGAHRASTCSLGAVENYSVFGDAPQLKSPADVALSANGTEWVSDTSANRLFEFNEKGELVLQAGGSGSGNGQLNGPRGIAVDSSGNVWVVDAGNHRVQEFNEQGEYVRQFGTFGTGAGQFISPWAVAVTSTGNVWVAEGAFGNKSSRLQEFSGEGVFIKQVGKEGVGNGEFSVPKGLAIDSLGNLWVADTLNNRVQELNSEGEFVSKFGTFGSLAGQLSSPAGIFVDSGGHVWVGDTGNNRVQEFASGGAFITQFGSAGSGNGQFSGLQGLAVSSGGNVWVADTGNSRIQELSSGGAFIAQAGSPSSGGQIVSPGGVAVSSGNIWATDVSLNRVVELNEKGEFLQQFGSAGSAAGQFNSPRGIAVDSKGNVWVVDAGNHRVQEFNGKGEFIRQFGTAGTGAGQFLTPWSVGVSSTGNVWVSDGAFGTGSSRLQEFTEEGVFVKTVGKEGSGNGELSVPKGLAVDSSGNVWVADTLNNRVQEFNSEGTFLQKFGTLGSGNGQLSLPAGIAVEAGGNVLVADTNNNRVEQFSGAGAFMSQFGSLGSAEGQLSAPAGVAAGSGGSVVIADTGNGRMTTWMP
jgi:DNA-binding beta-propeller fold protein YncE